MILTKNKPKLFFVTFCLLTLFISHAQKNPYNEVSIASPTAASLGKYADIPISYHTGLPQIKIPIYTIKEGTLQLPISLSYHASGLRVMEPASWVGAGWALNAGGLITRTVRGAPDERHTSSVDNQSKGHLSDSGYNNYIMYDEPSYPTGVSFWDVEFADGQMDGEPDLFFFNFGEYSGKFYFHDDGTAVLLPQQDIKIEYEYSPGFGKSIKNFTLTTPDGTKYFFGQTADTTDVDPIDKTNPFSDQGGLSQGQSTSSWYLNKISSADNQFSIGLTYSSENHTYYTISMFPINGDTTNMAEYRLIKNFVTGVRLHKISFTNGEIDFFAGTVRQDLGGGNSYQTLTPDYTNTEAKALDSIMISKSGSMCKKFIFSYGYFYDSTSSLPGNFSSYTISSDRRRLKLTSLQEKSCTDGVTIPAHTFEYFTDFVPRRLSFAQDHWGFYNGANNSTLIPTYTILDNYTSVSGANRDAAWPQMRGGALKKINYPTGGYSEFEFEPHYTWTEYNEYQWTFSFSESAGFDGSSVPDTSFHSFSGNPYKVVFTNSSQGSQALLKIYNNNNVEINGWVLEPGQNFQTILHYTSGTYKIILQKLSASTGNGTTASFSEWTTSLVQENTIVGGLRIKNLTHNDGVSTQNNIVTSYTYELNNKSTGILYSRPTYVQILRNDELQEAGMFTIDPNGPPYCSTNGCTNCDSLMGIPGRMAYFKSPSPIRPMETSQGNHMGYKEVKVSQTNNGYSIYNFFGSNSLDTILADVAYRTVDLSVCDIDAPSYPYAPPPTEFKRGELQQERHYNQTGTLLKEINYNYIYQDNPVTTPAIMFTGSPMLLATFYDLKTAKKIRDTVTTILYSGGQSLKTIKIQHYESPFHCQVTKMREITSTGDTLETKYKYAFDYRITNCDTISDGFTQYQSDWIDAIVEYQQNYVSCATGYCQFWTYSEYRKNLVLARNAYINRRGAYLTGTNSFKQCLLNAKSSADVQLKPILRLQELFDNPAIEVTKWRAIELLGATFSKYDSSTNPLGHVYLKKIQAINLAEPSSTFTISTVSGNTITKDSRYVDETTLTYNAGNLVELTKKDGITTAFIWGYNNTLPVARVTGASYSSVTATLNQTIIQNPSSDQALRNELADIRTDFPNALVNTYTYSRLLGITSETDANNRSFFYTYDGIGRLAIVRDHNEKILKKICYNYSGQTETCPVPTQDVTITCTNYTSFSGYTAVYTNTATQQQYSFNIPTTGGLQTLGTIPAGTYNLTISKSGGTFFLSFSPGCGLWSTGTSATFSNIDVSSCNSIVIDGL